MRCAPWQVVLVLALHCAESTSNPGVPNSREDATLRLLECLARSCVGGAGSSAGAASSPYVYLFTGAPVTGTSINSRSTGDAACVSARAGVTFPVNVCTNVRIAASYSAGDSLGNMATNYSVPTSLNVRGPTDVLVANNWADLTDGTIQVSLQTALVSTANYWTFSLSPANYDAGNGPCTGASGYTGNYTIATAAWISTGTGPCGTGTRFLCLCY